MFSEGMVQRDGSVVRLPVALGIIPYFSLGNIVVTRANCEQLNDRALFPMSKSGDNSVAFNPQTRTLTLTDARVEVSSTLAGLGVRSDINLVCMDSSEIVAEGAGAASLLVERACLVDGTGRLIATADGDGMALRLDGSLTLNGGYVKVVGKDRGVSGGNLPLTLNGGTLHAFGKHGHSIDAVGYTVFPALVAHAPKGGSYKGEPINAFVDSEQNPVINAPVIVGVASQSYGFKIGGVEENSHNAQQLGAKTVFPALQEGIISYDRASNAAACRCASYAS